MSPSSNDRARLSTSQPAATKKQARAPLALEQLEARMLMAFSILEQQIAHFDLGNSSLSGLEQNSALQSLPNLASRTPILIRAEGANTNLANGARIQHSSRELVLRVLQDAQGNVPNVQWAVTSADPLAKGVVQTTGDLVTITFNRPVLYAVSATAGTSTLRLNVNVTPTLTGLVVQSGQSKLNSSPLLLTNNKATIVLTGLDEIGRTVRITQPSTWELVSGPLGSNPILQSSTTRSKISFDRAGEYTFKVTNGGVSQTFQVKLAQTLGGIRIESPASSVAAKKTLQLSGTALDQFKQPLEQQPKITWSATGGTVDAQGLYTAGSRIGAIKVSAQVGRYVAKTTLTVVAASPTDNNGNNTNNNGNNSNGGSNSNNGGTQIVGIQDSTLRGLVTTEYADGVISREEMIRIIRSVGSDNVVSTTELTDLRFITSTASLKMPEYVRTLATNVVTTNAANLRYQGQAAGNLVAGSNASQVNVLVDKWFLGTDLPTLTSSSISYRTATGSLFPSTPSLDDSKQGQLGDCYFLAALISIANINQNAVRNMFVQNTDGTVSVRFFANGQADYVTVNRSLPSYSNGSLAYSGYGRSVTSSTTPLWLSLAEKAYAQWNETGKSGRNGTNTYSAIEGGWMGTVYQQVLGYSSSNIAVSSSSKQTLINSLNSQQAVTIGTNSGANAGGLVGGHAYVVTGYNSTTDTFSFYNPWSFQHPTALSWTQMQGQFSFFSVASPAGSSSNGSIVRADISNPGLVQTYYATTEIKQGENRTVVVESDVVLIENPELTAWDQAPTSNNQSTSHTIVEQQTITKESEPIDTQLVDLSILELV